MVNGGSWLVTGGTGSFGNAFVRTLLDDGASRVVVFSRDELKQSEMAAKFDDSRLRFFIGNVSNYDRLETAMRGVEFVVHAAALKRIDTCEDNVFEAVETNVLGTQNVARAAIACEVQRAVFLSTDKAAAPATHYGATKLVAEKLWVGSNVYAAGRKTRLAATRYGNVVGSRGSVVPIFQQQALLSGKLHVTEPRMSRFWMTLDDACQLVHEAFRSMRGGEVFVPKVRACALSTVAEAVAPGVPWHVVGVRRGEKLHETLISDDEARVTWEYPTHFRLEPERTWDDSRPTLHGQPVSADFSYRSDTAEQMSADEFGELAGLAFPHTVTS